jgi:hypothetical protein
MKNVGKFPKKNFRINPNCSGLSSVQCDRLTTTPQKLRHGETTLKKTTAGEQKVSNYAIEPSKHPLNLVRLSL